jgi:microcystin-dependent protein
MYFVADGKGGLCRGGLLALALVGLGPAAAASDDEREGRKPRLTLVSAEADLAGERLTVRGSGFGGHPLNVKLGFVRLAVLTAGPNEFVAELSPGIAAGTYLLTVTRGRSKDDFDQLDVTIGAVGPPGPAGPEGPMGEPGPAGGPIGVLLPYAGATAPRGWLIADGAAVSRSTYAALFAIVGTTYGSGDGRATFNLPDLRGRVPVAVGPSVAVNALGKNDGAPEADRAPTHSHGVPAHSHGAGSLEAAAAGPLAATFYYTTFGVIGNGCSSGTSCRTFVTSIGPGSTVFGTTLFPTTPAHGHGLAGRAGTGAVDGDSAMTAGSSGPSFIALNYIIRAE